MEPGRIDRLINEQSKLVTINCYDCKKTLHILINENGKVYDARCSECYERWLKNDTSNSWE